MRSVPSGNSRNYFIRFVCGNFVNDVRLQVKRENLTNVCNCAGDFKLMVSKKDMVSTLRTFRTISEYFKMPLLYETVSHNLNTTHL